MDYPYLQIEGDPTTWLLGEPINASALTSQEPFHATVRAGRTGTLILSGRAPASAVLSGVGNAIPSGGEPESPSFLYLPSVSGLKPATPGYELPPVTDLTALENDITAAMSQGTFYTVEASQCVLVLSGATLPFAVLFPAITSG